LQVIADDMWVQMGLLRDEMLEQRRAQREAA